MRKIISLSLLGLLFFFSDAYSQDANIELLKVEFENPKMHDTLRLKSLGTLLQERYNSNNPNYFYILHWMGRIIDKNLAESKVPDVRKAVTKWSGTYYSGMSLEAYQKGEIDKCIPYLDKSIAAFKSVKSYGLMYGQYVNKSKILCRINEWDKAVACLFEALRFYDKDEEKYMSHIGDINQAIADVYALQKKYSDAVVYYKKTLKYIDASDAHENIKDFSRSVTYHSLGNEYKQLKMYPEAVEALNNAIKYGKKRGDTTAQLDDQVSLGMVKLEQGKYDEAEEMLTNLLLLIKANSRSEANINLALARLYIEKKEYETAKPYAEKALDIGVRNKYLDIQRPATDFLIKINYETKDYKKAADMLVSYNKLKDSSKIEVGNNALKQQQLKYDFEKKELQQKILQEKKLSELKLKSEKEKAQQESENKLAQQQLTYNFEKKALNQRIEQQKKVSAVKLDAQKVKIDAQKAKLDAQKKTAAKNSWLVGLSGALLLVLLGLYFYYRNNKQKQAINVLEKDQIKQKLLVSQMNPHFIFNSIENIQQLIYDNKDKDAVNYLDKFSVLTRQILENSNENYIPLSEEVAMLGNYLAIQQLLYGNKFDFSITVEETVDAEAIFLPPMLTQPFIENAIKHGLAAKDANGKVDIRFYLNEGKLFFEVLDNGKGFDASKRTDNHKSLAMVITKDRLVSYTKNQDFVVQADNIKDKNEKVVGAKVVFEIPYIYEN